MILSFVLMGCTEYRECITCTSFDKDLHSCEEDVLGWNYESLSNHYMSNGYDTCYFSFEEMIVWGHN